MNTIYFINESPTMDVLIRGQSTNKNSAKAFMILLLLIASIKAALFQFNLHHVHQNKIYDIPR